MEKRRPLTLADLAARVEEQGREISALRAAIAGTAQHIAGSQVERNQAPYTERRTDRLRALLIDPQENGNGDHHD